MTAVSRPTNVFEKPFGSDGGRAPLAERHRKGVLVVFLRRLQRDPSSHKILTALAPAFANNLDAAAFTAMRPSVVTDRVGLETLTVVLSKVS